MGSAAKSRGGGGKRVPVVHNTSSSFRCTRLDGGSCGVLWVSQGIDRNKSKEDEYLSYSELA
eukprot:227177-Amphidinium_carterae.2